MPRHLFLICLLTTALVVSCSDDDDTSTGPDVITDAIVPLASGNTWVMERTRVEQNSTGIFNDTIMVDAPSDINGVEWYPVGTAGTGSQRFFRNATEGLKIYEKNEESLYLPYPAAVGDSTVANTSEGLMTIFVLSTDELVETPAGTFTCYKYYWEEFTGAQYTQYYAPNVGPVKFEMELSYTSPQYPDGYHLKETSVLIDYSLELPD